LAKTIQLARSAVLQNIHKYVQIGWNSDRLSTKNQTKSVKVVSEGLK